MTRFAAITAGVVVSISLAIGGYIAISPPRFACSSSAVSGQAAIGGAFTLRNQHGQTVTDKQLFDKGLSLVYFGYTFCPDVCSLDVARNVTAVDLAQAQGIDAKPVFISFDPKRDTVKALADYAEAFHPDMIALTGTQAQIDEAVKAYRVYYRNNGAQQDYLFDHSSFTYLVGVDGFLEFFRHETSPTDIVNAMQCFASV